MHVHFNLSASFLSILLSSKEPATPHSSVSLTIFMHNSYSTVQTIAKIFIVTRPKTKPSKMPKEITYRE